MGKPPSPNGPASNDRDDEALKEFLVESHENLDQLDRDFVALEADPGAKDRIGGIFRTIHTIKGTSGFLGFSHLEELTHGGESLLSMLRDGQISLTPEITSALLAMVDRVRGMLRVIEATGAEGNEPYADVLATLNALRTGEAAPKVESSAHAAATARPAAPSAPPPAAATPKPSPIEAHLPPLTEPRISSAPPPKSARPPAPKSTHPPASKSARPPAHEAKKEEPATPSGPSAVDTSVRVDVGLLDKLMNLVGELVLARNQIVQFGVRIEDPGFVSASQRLNHCATELQEHVMKTRMQPIGNVWSKLPRIVRDLAIQCGKQVRVEMIGKDTELDRTIIEAIKDPLTHIVRNAVDHGIETPDVRATKGKPRTGALVLRAYHEGGQVNIEISDDGAGLAVDRIRAKAVERGVITPDRAARLSDREVAQLVFLPGFSTAAKITNVSGRGVGMDVVKTNIERIGGTVDLLAPPSGGTKIKIKIPLTLAIVPALTVTSADQRYAIPQVNLLELVRLENEQAKTAIERIHGTPVYRLRGRLLPLVFLNEQLKREAISAEGTSSINIVVLQADDRQFGLVVDEVRDTEEIVVKPLGKELKSLSLFAGATIMGDGRVALILDVLGLAQHAGAVGRAREKGALGGAKVPALSGDVGTIDEKQALLLFGYGADETMALPLSMVARLEEFPRSRLERAGKRRVVQYRGEILPLIDVAEAMGAHAPPSEAPVHVIVYSNGERSIGFVVSRILDVVEDAVRIDRSTSQRGLLGSAVIQSKVTDLLDVEGVIRAQYPTFFEGKAA